MKQAIIVIHGVGEQKPMDTVRGFVDAVMPLPPNPAKPKFWSKPDPLSELFELRKLTCPQSATVPPTDFYEYYWAYQSRGTRFAHVVSWAWSLLVRHPQNVPRHLRALWFSLWFLFLAAALLLSSGYWGKWTKLGEDAISKNHLIGYLSLAVLSVLSGFIINYVGDAARYLNPLPPNIRMRREIRAEGIELLRRLHRSGQYDRVVLVGHSLGSVIAYDLLKHFWLICSTDQAPPTRAYLDMLSRLEQTGIQLAARPSRQLADEFRQLQAALWAEQRRMQNPWLVTDLVTVGSPLAHAELLLARTRKELLERQTERELPTCPPITDDGHYSYSFAQNENGHPKTMVVLHHGAHFACTRWTNLYFPAALGFFGDLVGGPLANVFGHGIQDIPVDSAEWVGWLKYFPLIHTHYWSKKSAPQGPGGAPKAWSLPTLDKALGLASRDWLQNVKPVPEIKEPI